MNVPTAMPVRREARITPNGRSRRRWATGSGPLRLVAGPLIHLTRAQHERLWGDQTFYRVFSRVNGGRSVETDLFEGVRTAAVNELCA